MLMMLILLMCSWAEYGNEGCIAPSEGFKCWIISINQSIVFNSHGITDQTSLFCINNPIQENLFNYTIKTCHNTDLTVFTVVISKGILHITMLLTACKLKGYPSFSQLVIQKKHFLFCPLANIQRTEMELFIKVIESVGGRVCFCY